METVEYTDRDGTSATPREVAEWMFRLVCEQGQLLQVEAVKGIRLLFGAEFVYLHPDIGEWSIDRRVLYHFRRLGGDAVVCVTCRGGGYCPEAYWRKRTFRDAPGRTQHEL